jgi:hypothetical protein
MYPCFNARVIRRADAHRQIARLKGGAANDILMFDSRRLWEDLLLDRVLCYGGWNVTRD